MFLEKWNTPGLFCGETSSRSTLENGLLFVLSFFIRIGIHFTAILFDIITDLNC